MLLVKTKTGPSQIQGTGLFADEPIKAGTVVWKFDPRIDAVAPRTDEVSLLYAYTSKQTGRIITPGDDARHVNHSVEPNLGTRYEDGVEEDINFAIRDIAAGEELTLDYRIFAEEGADFLK